MYGLIYNTIKSLVVVKVCNGDDAKWKEICLKAGVDDADFLNYQYYDEESVGKLTQAAATVLGIPLENILEKFGEHFFEKTKESGHSYMLNTLGYDLFGFLVNLDSLHSHLSTAYLEMRAPSFQCEKTDEGLQLHYYSCRPGLQCIVIGIVKAVAKDFFKLDIDMKLELSEKLEGVWLCNHYMFDITVKESSRDDPTWIERLQGERVNNVMHGMLQLPISARNSSHLDVLIELKSETSSSSIGGNPAGPLPTSGLATGYTCPFVTVTSQDDLEPEKELEKLEEEEEEDNEEEGSNDEGETKVENEISKSITTSFIRNQLVGVFQPPRASPPAPLLPHLSFATPSHSRRGSILIPTDDWPINPYLFRSLFPFHIIFDHNLVIKFMGVSLSRIFPNAIFSQAKLTDYFTVERPAIPAFTFQHIRSRAHNEFILQTKTVKSKNDRSIQFRGQMVPTSSSSPNPTIVYIASPRVKSIQELEDQGLYLSDIPVHDVTRDLILLNHQLRAEMNTATQLELMKSQLEVEKTRVQNERERADKLLHAMLPESIARQLKLGVEARATFHSQVTILFSDIESFTTICSQCDHPVEVVKMLNDLYTGFDSFIDEFRVYKVETIGDAYMVAAGLLDTAEDHGFAVTSFSFKMRTCASNIMSPTTGQPLKIRIGIHTGAVMAGVVGLLMPRYCLFGDTVNVASRMESHGQAGKVHLSESTFDMLTDKPVLLTSRGEILIKGLETPQRTYFAEPAPKYTVIEAKSSSQSLKKQKSDSFVSLHNSTPRSSFSVYQPSQSSLSAERKISIRSRISNNSMLQFETHAEREEEPVELHVPINIPTDTPIHQPSPIDDQQDIVDTNINGNVTENGEPPIQTLDDSSNEHTMKHRKRNSRRNRQNDSRDQKCTIS